MLRTIARKELLDTWRDGRFRGASVIVLLLLVVSSAVGWRHFRMAAQERAVAERHVREVWLNQGSKDPHVAAHFGTFTFLPDSPLAFLDQGITPYTGVSVYLEAHRMNTPQYSRAQDGTALQKFGEMTGALVLQSLIPLLIILFAFGAFAQERESGTLRQVLSTGAPLPTLVTGKILGLGAAIGLVLTPAAILGAIALTLQSGQVEVARTIGLTSGYLVYFAVTLAVSLAVSMLVRSSRAALVVLLAWWGWSCLVAPRALTDASQAMHPAANATEFNALVDGDRRGKGVNLAQVRTQLMKEFNVTDPADLPVNPRGVLQQRNEAHTNEVWDHRFNELWDQYERQSEMISWGGLLAPMTAIRAISMSFAGTDFAHYRDFAWEAERHRRTMVGILNDDLAAHTQADYVAGPELWRKIPEFRYTTPSFLWAVRQQKSSWTALGVWIVAALGAVAWATRRMSL